LTFAFGQHIMIIHIVPGRTVCVLHGVPQSSKRITANLI
jgi:hypothetical protein